jgi:hypothetical protein
MHIADLLFNNFISLFVIFASWMRILDVWILYNWELTVSNI